LVRGIHCCDPDSAELARNYIPEFQIWGDGRYIWVVHEEDGSRSVLESRLSQLQILDVLERAAGAGFFTWSDTYTEDGAAGSADRCLAVHLLSAFKQVCTSGKTAPGAFSALFVELAAGSGLQGVPLFPARGFLRLTPLVEDLAAPSLVWDDPRLPLSRISENGTWIGGDTLTPLWNALNRRPLEPVVRERDANYLFTIQIEGISLTSPAAP